MSLLQGVLSCSPTNKAKQSKALSKRTKRRRNRRLPLPSSSENESSSNRVRPQYHAHTYFTCHPNNKCVAYHFCWRVFVEWSRLVAFDHVGCGQDVSSALARASPWTVCSVSESTVDKMLTGGQADLLVRYDQYRRLHG